MTVNQLTILVLIKTGDFNNWEWEESEKLNKDLIYLSSKSLIKQTNPPYWSCTVEGVDHITKLATLEPGGAV